MKKIELLHKLCTCLLIISNFESFVITKKIKFGIDKKKQEYEELYIYAGEQTKKESCYSLQTTCFFTFSLILEIVAKVVPPIQDNISSFSVCMCFSFIWVFICNLSDEIYLLIVYQQQCKTKLVTDLIDPFFAPLV